MKKINLLAIATSLGVVGLAGAGTAAAVTNVSTESQVFVNVAPVIELSVVAADDSTSIVKMQGVANDFVNNSAVASVTTNSRYGYYLYMESANNYTDLRITGATGSEPSITSLTTQKQKSNFASDEWGYFKNDTGTSVDTTYFRPIPAKNNADMLRGNNPSDTTDSANSKAANDQTTVTFGAKIGTTLPMGTYSNVVKFTAITKYTPSTLDSVSYLQDMTQTICAATTTPAADASVDAIPTNYLRDARDGKYYKVQKLADGNCWMTEDLALSATDDEDAARVLTSANSDVTADFTMPAGTTGAYPFDTATAVVSGTSVGTICPAGWTLPVRSGDTSTNGSVDKLSATYTGYLTEFNTAFGTGTWWTKTADTTSTSYALSFDGTEFATSAVDNANTNAVRCYVSGS